MEALLKYLAFAPAYAMDLAGLLASPKTFLKTKIREGDQDWAEALTFFAISIIIAFLIQTTGVNLIQATTVKLDPAILTGLMRAILLSAICTLVIAVLIKIAWRFVGGRAPLHSILLTQFYVFSAYVLIMCCIALIFVSLHALFYPGYYHDVSRMTHEGFFNVLYQVINNPDTASLLSPVKYPGLLQLGIVMLGISCLVSVAWTIAIWGAYRQLNEASRIRSFAAFILCGMFSVPCFGILLLLIAGGLMPGFEP
jgi:hypothetical protein